MILKGGGYFNDAGLEIDQNFLTFDPKQISHQKGGLMTAQKSVLEMTFPELETLNTKDWLDKVKEWIGEVEKTLEDYEVSSCSFNLAIPPSATVTLSKKNVQ